MRKFKKAIALVLAVMMLASLAIVGVSAEVVEKTYTVAGSSALCGTNWSETDTNNDMALGSDGKYFIVYSDVAVANNYELKVVVNHDWKEAYGDNGQNYKFNVTEVCNVTITFDPETNEVAAWGDGVAFTSADDWTVESMYVVGDCFTPSWDPANENCKMTEIAENVWSITVEGLTPSEDASDTYSFKFAANGEWADSWGADGAYNGEDISLFVPASGKVTFTLDLTNFDYSTKEGAVYTVADADEPATTEPGTEEVTEPGTEEVTEPSTEEVTEPSTEEVTEPVTEEPFVIETVVIRGTFTGGAWDGSTDAECTLTEGGDGVYSITKDIEAGTAYEFKVVLNGERWIGKDNTDANYKFNVAADTTATFTFDPATYAIGVTGEGIEAVTELTISSLRAVGNGSGAWLNGVSWDPNSDANLLTGADGVYTITYTSVPRDTGYEFKFTANGTDWADNWGGAFVAFGEAADAVYNAEGNITFALDQYDFNDVTLTFDATAMQADGSGAKFTISVAEGQAPATDATEPATGEPQPAHVAGWYVVGSKDLCGKEWADEGAPLPEMKMELVDGAYTVTINNVPAGEYTFKVVETRSTGNVKTWHPDGMGNDSSVSVLFDGSTVVITLVPQLNPSDDVAVATVYAPGEEPTQPASEEVTTPTEETTPVKPAATTVKFSVTKKTVTYGKTATVKATVKNGKGTTTYTTSNKKVATVDKNGKVVTKGVGTAKITAANNGVKATYTLTVSKADNTIKAASKKTLSLKASAVKSKAKTYKASTFAVTKAQGKVVYTKTSKKGVSVNSSGTITVKKGTKKGTYKLTVKITAKGNANYKSKTVKTVLTVKVK